MAVPALNVNSVDPDQPPRVAVSNLGLHCLPMSLIWDTRHKWVKGKNLRPKGYCFHLKWIYFSEGSSYSYGPVRLANTISLYWLIVRLHVF